MHIFCSTWIKRYKQLKKITLHSWPKLDTQCQVWAKSRVGTFFPWIEKVDGFENLFIFAIFSFCFSFWKVFLRQNIKLLNLEVFEEYSYGYTEFPNTNLGKTGPEVDELWSDIQTNRRTDKQRLLLSTVIQKQYLFDFRLRYLNER